MPVNPKSKDCVADEMRRFKSGQLHSGENGPAVKSRKQAIAVALNACGKSDYVETLRSLGYPLETAEEVVAMFAEIDWEKQFDKGGGPGPEKKENYNTGTVHIKGITGARIGKTGPGNMGKLKVNSDASVLEIPRVVVVEMLKDLGC